MTEKLYDQDAYQAAFTATVLASEKTEDGWQILLNRTAFFPREGGQNADTGMLGERQVTDVILCHGELWHQTDGPLSPGSIVEGRIDFARRFDHMQNHTGEHIVSGVVSSRFGLHNVGFRLNEEEVTMDYDGFLTREQLNEIEDAANRAVFACLPVSSSYRSPQELETLTYRSKLDLKENVRIVEIPGVDVCACCAPHVKNTGEVGLIKLLDAPRYKGGVRVHMKAGTRALREFQQAFETASSVAAALSVKQTDALATVEKVLQENREKNRQLAERETQLALGQLDTCTYTEGSLCLFCQQPEAMKELANRAVTLCGRAAAVLCENGEGFRYMIVSRTLPLKEMAGEINRALSGRGGGSNEMLQGQFSASRQEIEAFFRCF